MKHFLLILALLLSPALAAASTVEETCKTFGESALHTANARDIGVPKQVAIAILEDATGSRGDAYIAIMAIIESVYANPDASPFEVELAVTAVCIEAGGWVK